jgi:transposase-like protein
MNSKKEQVVAEKVKKRRTPPKESALTASERAQAVLAIWTDRVKITEVVKTLGVTYSTLMQWQERAMEGMLQALEPRVNLSNGAALPPRIRALMDKRQQQLGKESLKKRLLQLAEVAPEGKPPSDP